MSERLRRAAENPAVGGAVALIERLDSRRTTLLRVLTYHRVDEGEPFARQMEYLARRYPIVSIPQVLIAADGGEPLPPLALLLTFDDAYRSFAEVAWPILRRHGFPAAMFVPTAYPDSAHERFWWDRLEQGFRRTARREALTTPIGRFVLGTEAERGVAYSAVKRWIKDLAHEETLACTARVCAELGETAERHEVMGWAELRTLAAEGLAVGAHTRTHPRLDRIGLDRAREEVIGSVRDLERELPGEPRIFAYPDGRFSDEIVRAARASGVELAFTTRRGSNDLVRSDRLRLRRVHVDSRDSVAVLRAKLAFASPRWSAVQRAIDPPNRDERAAERANRAERKRVKLVYRPLDAALTSALRPRSTLAALRGLARRRASHYERIGHLARLCTPGETLETRLQRALLDSAHLPFGAARVELLGYGSGTTVFRLHAAPGSPLAATPRVLKVYRRSLGCRTERLLHLTRRYRQRYASLREWFGELVLPAEFVVLHGPLRGRPAVACIQELLPQANLDLLGRSDAQVLELLHTRRDLARQFERFVRRALEWRARGFFPDLVGAGNLRVLELPAGDQLRLIDYGAFDLRTASARIPRAALEAIAARLGALASQLRDEPLLAHRS